MVGYCTTALFAPSQLATLPPLFFETHILDIFFILYYSSGAFHGNSWYVKEYNNANKKNETITFYDSNTGNLLFEAGSGGRSLENFWNESGKHGWPSFRDQEVNWEFVRCLPNGECVSLHGTHLVRYLLTVRGRIKNASIHIIILEQGTLTTACISILLYPSIDLSIYISARDTIYPTKLATDTASISCP